MPESKNANNGLGNQTELRALPSWVLHTWHLAAIGTLLIVSLLTVFAYRNMREMERLNEFLVRAQIRGDSLRAAQRPLLDSLLRRR